MSLESSVVLVTGGGSGIGRATAKRFAELGAKVTIAGRTQVKLTAALEHLPEGVSTETFELSVRDSVESLLSAVVERHGSLDIVVNSAAIQTEQRSFQDLEPETLVKLLETNTLGALHLLQAASEHMKENGGGHFISISSVAGSNPSVAAGAAYTASKHALNGLVKTAQRELREHGIRCSTISPGLTNTPLVDTRPGKHDEEDRKRMLQPKDVADAVLFIAQLPENAFVEDLILRPQW